MIVGKHEQPRLDRLGAYPFQRLRRLLAGVRPASGLVPIDAGAGEPRLPQPAFVAPQLEEYLNEFSQYPPTSGALFVREAMASWLVRRYGLASVDPSTQVLTANGTREALFSVAQALVNPEVKSKPRVLMPNPMYQIYYGGAVMAGARPWLMTCTEATQFAPDLEAVPGDVWMETAFVYVCSPSNPTGWVADHDWYRCLIELADEHDFYIVADECYSEIFWREQPVGLLEVCQSIGRADFSRCLVMNSLSKRSALPGLRSGLIAGDARLIARFAKLRSYTGPATPLPLQRIAAMAWSDEYHVGVNQETYRRSLQAFYEVWGHGSPPAGTFFVWLDVGDGEAFARAAYQQQAVTVLPGAYLSARDGSGKNPGTSYIRAALVDGEDQAAELARRLRQVRV